MDQSIITLISACTALTASILAPIVTLRAARTQFNANVLSANRQRWIETFRELVASFLSQLFAVSLVRSKIIGEGFASASTDPAILSRIERMVLTTSKIKLMVNPKEADHQRLIDLITGAIDFVRNAPPEQNIEPKTEAMMNEISMVCQGVLKREWVRVKLGR